VCRRKVQILKTPVLRVEGGFTLAPFRAARRLGKSFRHELSQPPTRLGFLRHHGRVRLLGYTRVSTAGQDARLQLDALVGAGVQKRDVFADVTSGTRAGVDRPGMQKLLAYAEAGDTVVVWRVDRLGRSLIDVLNTVNLLRERGVYLRSVSDAIDPATTAGRMMLNMFATLAEYERELIVERVNAGIASARERGTRFGRPPADPAVIADKLAIANEARARGRSAQDAARLVGWSRATFYRHQRAPHAVEQT
jgi:DNA invertase Pin-like site-specific DNA recombinase